MKKNSLKRASVTVRGILAICALSAVLMAATAIPSQATQSSNSRNAWIPTGHMALSNNWWGVGSGVYGWQSIWLYSPTSWGTNWSWGGGVPYYVKTYAEMVDGWNWGGFNGAPFPYVIWGDHPVNVSWWYNNNNSGTQDVSFDCFFNTNSNPGYSNPTDEMMVWLQANGGAGPLGSYKRSLYIDNAWWNVYQGKGSWNVVSFVRQGNVGGANLNLMDFARQAAVYNMLSWNDYFLNVDTGTEIFHGNGALQTTWFSAP